MHVYIYFGFVCLRLHTKQIFFVEQLMSEKESVVLNPKSVTAGQFEFTSIRLPLSDGQDISSYAKEHVYSVLQLE